MSRRRSALSLVTSSRVTVSVSAIDVLLMPLEVRTIIEVTRGTRSYLSRFWQVVHVSPVHVVCVAVSKSKSLVPLTGISASTHKASARCVAVVLSYSRRYVIPSILRREQAPSDAALRDFNMKETQSTARNVSGRDTGKLVWLATEVRVYAYVYAYVHVWAPCRYSRASSISTSVRYRLPEYSHALLFAGLYSRPKILAVQIFLPTSECRPQ